jgi:hypothetical protein
MILIKNKGQVSIFIIIGLILVMGAIFLFSQQGTSIPFFQDQSPGYKTTLAIEEFTQSCIDQRTRAGIQLLGLQGGWINPRERGIISEFRDPEYLTERANGFAFLGETPLLYWDYYDNVKEEFRQNNIPSYDDATDSNSMKSQLEQYVVDTINEKCLQNYNQFLDVAEVVFNSDEIEVTSIFRDEIIEVTLDFEIEINHNNIDKVDYLDSYEIETQNKLRVPYFLARDIVNTQSINSLFEKNILSTLLAYQSTEDTNLLPPFADTTNSYDYKVWNLEQTQTLVQQILENNIGYTQFKETKESTIPIPQELQNLPLAQGLQNVYVKNFFGENREYSIVPENQKGEMFREYNEFVATPKYNLLYPMSFSIENGYGDFLFMSDPKFLLPFPVQVATTDFQAAYKITAPIVVELKDSRQDLNDPFVFNLPLEINIKHNAPLRENYVLDLSGIDFENQNIGSSLICNPSQFRSQPYTINITDSINFAQTGINGVEDALVEFQCNLGIATCSLGTTQISNGQTYLNFKLPENCFPGNLKITKFGHQSIERIISEDGTNFGQVDMPSTKKLKLKIGTISTSNIQNDLTVGTQGGESGMIIFEHKTEESMTKVISFDDISTDFYDTPPTIELLPGSYSIQAFIFQENPGNKIAQTIIPCDGGGGLFGGDCPSEEERTLPEFELETWITGQYILEEFEVTIENLIEHDILTMPILRVRMPNSYSDLEEASEQSADIPQISQQREPQFCTDEENSNDECRR